MNEEQFATSKDGFKHLPVLYREVLEYLTFDGPCRIIDGTLGSGGVGTGTGPRSAIAGCAATSARPTENTPLSQYCHQE